MTDKAVYDAIRPLESNHTHYRLAVDKLTSELASKHAQFQKDKERLEAEIEENIRIRDFCYAALEAAKEAVRGL